MMSRPPLRPEERTVTPTGLPARALELLAENAEEVGLRDVDSIRLGTAAVLLEKAQDSLRSAEQTLRTAEETLTKESADDP